ncbi:MAG TPA: hypothetical protein VNZ44_12615 [Pyrinomonadaceae bacterium]|nr:hypothetical protein [Pyrinomonadaceae bacterium]
MSQDRTPAKVDEGRVGGASTSDRTFRYALVIHAVVEFVAVALFVYYKVSR